MLKRILREPLVHFFIIGGLLFGLYTLLHPVSVTNKEKNIVINQAVLKNLVNLNSKSSLSDGQIDSYIDSLDDAAKTQMMTDYVRDEALYQEALRMGLDKNDFLIKRRLIQKLLFLIEDLNTSNIQVDDITLRAYFDKHKNDYLSSPSISFSHVYFSFDKSYDDIESHARKVLTKLNDSPAKQEQAQLIADVFPMKSIYGDALFNEVVAHFGKEFTTQLFSFNAEDFWQGPIKSPYGYHLVKVMNKKSPKQATFSEIKEKLKQQYIYEQLKRRNEAITQRIVNQYTVINKMDVRHRENQ